MVYFLIHYNSNLLFFSLLDCNMVETKRGALIVFEGLDRSGKSTQASSILTTDALVLVVSILVGVKQSSELHGKKIFLG